MDDYKMDCALDAIDESESWMSEDQKKAKFLAARAAAFQKIQDAQRTQNKRK